MSVEVNQLTKIYNEQRAVDNVTFRAQPGEILGFLGPNGAGKSTIMKIITCFLPQTGGQVEVCGHDTIRASKAVRRLIGYLPENNPLYKDMYVREYLRFVARLHKLDRLDARVRDMIERTGLEREQKKPIGALSKGYRQRVGLAQALLHDPEVLVLDEPTSGLDPNQLAEIRRLIQDLGKEKTVIFSTHIMQEVQALCDRVLIINQGKIVANDPIERLQERIQGEMVITVGFDSAVQEAQLRRIDHVKRIKHLGKNRWQLTSDRKQDIRPDVFRFAVDRKLVLLEMHRDAFTVEDVFQQLTQTQAEHS